MTATIAGKNHEKLVIDVTVPAYNEEHVLECSIGRLDSYLETQTPGPYEITIADNGSIDRTFEIARQLAGTRPHVRVLHLDERGRGRAIKRAWTSSKAQILSYMDVDLSSDLAAFPALIDAVTHGGFDLAVGSRLLKPQLTKRCLKREMISRAYNLLVKTFFRTSFSDAQCGFKAITRAAADELLPLIEDNNWFFDTELLVIAEKLGYRIFDLPVPWVEDPDSRVQLLRTAWQDIRGLIRLRRKLGRAEPFQRLTKVTSSRSKSEVGLISLPVKPPS